MYSAFEWRVESPGHDELRCVFFLINGTVMLLDLPREEDEQDAKVPRNDFSLRPSEEREVLERIARLVRTIATGTAMWSAQFEREQGKESPGFPEWRWSNETQALLSRYADSAGLAAAGQAARFTDPYDPGRNSIILLLNAFPLELRWYGDALMEIPPTHLAHGIRPLLYTLLRRDLLRRLLRKCNRLGCDRYFEASRPDKFSCSNECSAKVAQQKNYREKTKPQRQEKSRLRKLQKANLSNELQTKV
jgi:hypothetical protein